ncbi:MAG: branched-chain amino acid ABC transporter substrate-binding protein, partial [Comamonadaceae bacterium]|nr:branched-chain amino acid ABC transporter substrate-binding protein [Comamonadaceae bacterium]
MHIFSASRRLLLSFGLTCAATVSMAQAIAPSAAPIRIGMIEGLSGPFANTGEAVYRNLVWATERVNARGGVKLPGGNRPLLIERFDSKGQTEEALSALRSAIDRNITIVTQGNSSAAASGLIDAIGKHNQRDA